MHISVQVDFRRVATALSVDMPAQIPFAAAMTLTRLAKDARAKVVSEMPVAFDRPTPWTLGAPDFLAAKKSDLESVVFLKQTQEQRGKSKQEHLRPGSLGALQRAQKKTEFLLTRLGELPAGWVTVPGNKMPKDAYGNMPGSIYKQVVNVLQMKVRYGSSTKPVSKASQKRAARMGVGAEFFTVTPGANNRALNGGWLPPGVWKHLPGRQIVQVLKFVKKASYKPRLDMQKIVSAEVDEKLSIRWAESFAQAVATAMPRRGA